MSKLGASSITKASAADASRCLAAFVTAFAGDPLMRWMMPEAATYLEFSPQVGRFYGGRAFEHGTAFRTDDFAGAALWLPPGVGPDEEALGAVMEQAVDASRLGEVYGLLEQVSQAHPEEPHWFLPVIGVDPRRQGNGYGSALLARSLELCDREHVVAYLESSNPRNIPLYQRFGFEVVGEIQCGSSPTVTPMIRPARPRS